MLVTGAAGFLGGHLSRLLRNAGWRVVGVDRSPRPAGFPGEYTQADLADSSSLNGLFTGVSHVAHLAALASVEACEADPEQSLRDNLMATQHVVAAAAEAGVRRLVFASSAAVYSPEGELPQCEESVDNPGSVYAKHKLMGENCLRNHARGATPPDCVSLRFFNIYGPGQQAGIVARVVECALGGKTLQVQGDGEQTRDFLHVRDATRALQTALTRERAFHGMAINVGSGSETSVNALAKLAEEVSGRQVATDEVEARPGDLRRSCADVRRAKAELTFECAVGLAEGLGELIRVAGAE